MTGNENILSFMGWIDLKLKEDFSLSCGPPETQSEDFQGWWRRFFHDPVSAMRPLTQGVRGLRAN